MPRTKAESTADAVEEQKTDAVEDTAPVQAEEPKAPAESNRGTCRRGRKHFQSPKRMCCCGIKSRRSNNVYSV